MSLFREIRRLCLKDAEQHEDILTEIIAAVLRNNRDLVQRWLNSLEIPCSSDAEISLSTQYAIERLDHHETDSRVDLVLRLSDPSGSRIVFVESKVGSVQGENQLLRYAQLLEKECREAKASGTLVFITRNFEKAERPPVPGIQFVTQRWFQFYNILKSGKSSDGLEKQLMLFMEELHMSVGNQFRSTDLVALENFRAAKALMDQTLEESFQAWKGLFGKRGQINKAHSQMGKDGRYMIVTRFPGFSIELGYWLPEGSSDEGMSLGAAFYSDPKAGNHGAVVDAFRAWATESGQKWKTENIDNPGVRAGLSQWEWLRVFLTGDDHVAVVKAYFRDLVEDIRAFQARFPDLPWTPTETKEEEGE